MIALYCILGILGVILIVVLAQVLPLALQKNAPERPNKEKVPPVTTTKEDAKNFLNVYLFLTDKADEGVSFTQDEMYEILSNKTKYVDRRYDCSDFLMPMLFKIHKEGGHKLDTRNQELIKNCFLNFKYFMDEPGDDSMCLWSENHQILFAVNEYLAGDEWADETFTNANITGQAHKDKAEIRVNAWMEQRFKFGFSEYMSSTYLKEDIGALANFIYFVKDETLKAKMSMIMDILWLDVALNSVNKRVAAASSRMYGDDKSGNYLGNSFLHSMNKLWGEDCMNALLTDDCVSEDEIANARGSLSKPNDSMSAAFNSLVDDGKYKLPAVIKEIATSRDTFSVKMGCGLSPEDMDEENLIGAQPHQIMAQWGAETFTNPQVIQNTVSYIKNNDLNKNAFIGYFKFLSVFPLNCLNLKKSCAKREFMTHGIALGRGNMYTYRTKHYSMTTLMNKDVDCCGAQEHIWTANIAEALTLYTHHPAGKEDAKFGSSPGYWIGNGRRPMSVQNENVNISIYKLPKKIRLPELGIVKMTHAYAPKCFYDESELTNNIFFGKKNGVFVALIGSQEMKFKPHNPNAMRPFYKTHPMENEPERNVIKGEFDLCMHGGEYHAYVTELSDVTVETFEEFKARIKGNSVKFSGDSVEYITASGKLNANYGGEFKVNDELQDTTYKRYDCKYVVSDRKAEKIVVSGETGSLEMNYNKAERIIK
ncbi:MAG: hypothetical protein R3Y27_03180 [Clostridia bacterium]